MREPEALDRLAYLQVVEPACAVAGAPPSVQPGHVTAGARSTVLAVEKGEVDRLGLPGELVASGVAGGLHL